MADTATTTNTNGSFWGGIWDGLGQLGTAAATIYVAQQAAKGSATPGATGAGVPAASLTTPGASSSNNVILYVVLGVVGVVALLFGVKMLGKK